MKNEFHNIQYRFRDKLSQTVQEYVNYHKPHSVIDPFCGVPYVISKIKRYEQDTIMRRIGSDINPYLIAMLKRFNRANVDDLYCSELLINISSQTYKEMQQYAKLALKNHFFLQRTPGFPSWQIGCGLYLGSVDRNFDKGFVGEDEYRNNRLFFTKQGRSVRHTVSVQRADYRKWELLPRWKIQKRLFYCNYPEIKVGNKYDMNPYSFYYWFDIDEFFSLMEKWSEYHIVIICGKQCPNNYTQIWEHGGSSEKLFIHNRWMIG